MKGRLPCSAPAFLRLANSIFCAPRCFARLGSVAGIVSALFSANAWADPPPSSEPTEAPKDDLPNPGYVPGYRHDKTLGLSPYVPKVGALPGGMTPAYAA